MSIDMSTSTLPIQHINGQPLNQDQQQYLDGFFAGLGSFVLSARLNSAEAVAGTGYELTVIASVVIGRTSLFGGAGSIFGTVIGTLLNGVLLNGLVLMNVNSYIQQIIIGIIIVLAVAFDTFAQSRRRRA